jgi:hypothetical protein
MQSDQELHMQPPESKGTVLGSRWTRVPRSGSVRDCPRCRRGGPHLRSLMKAALDPTRISVCSQIGYPGTTALFRASRGRYVDLRTAVSRRLPDQAMESLVRRGSG